MLGFPGKKKKRTGRFYRWQRMKKDLTINSKKTKKKKKKQFLPPGKKPRIYKKANETIICEYSAQQTQNFTQSWI